MNIHRILQMFTGDVCLLEPRTLRLGGQILHRKLLGEVFTGAKIHAELGARLRMPAQLGMIPDECGPHVKAHILDEHVSQLARPHARERQREKESELPRIAGAEKRLLLFPSKDDLRFHVVDPHAFDA